MTWAQRVLVRNLTLSLNPPRLPQTLEENWITITITITIKSKIKSKKFAACQVSFVQYRFAPLLQASSEGDYWASR